MSTLVQVSKVTKAGKTMTLYMVISFVCAVFSGVYQGFSHGVYSNYMIGLFLIPLLGGALPFLLIKHVKDAPYPSQVALNSFHAGIATLTVGSCLQGALEIYGTSSYYMPVYWVLGCLLVSLGVIHYGIVGQKKHI